MAVVVVAAAVVVVCLMKTEISADRYNIVGSHRKKAILMEYNFQRG